MCEQLRNAHREAFCDDRCEDGESVVRVVADDARGAFWIGESDSKFYVSERIIRSSDEVEQNELSRTILTILSWPSRTSDSRDILCSLQL